MLDNARSFDPLPSFFEPNAARAAAYPDFGYTLPEEAMRYARQLTSDPEHRALMDALDNTHMLLEFAEGRGIVRLLNAAPHRTERLGRFYEPVPLTRLFPGNEGRIFVAEIEERRQQAAQAFGTDHLCIKFRTISKAKPLPFHKHNVPVWVGIYADPPTETVDANYLDEDNWCTDNSKTNPLALGSTGIIPEGTFHRELYKPRGGYRFWNAVFPEVHLR